MCVLDKNWPLGQIHFNLSRDDLKKARVCASRKLLELDLNYCPTCRRRGADKQQYTVSDIVAILRYCFRYSGAGRFCFRHLNDWEIAGYVASFAALRPFLMINSADTIDVNALLSASNKKGSL